MRKLSSVLLFFTLTILASAQTSSHFDGHTWWDYIKVIADDKMEGRDTGSRGERAAQEYAVEQLNKAGLERWKVLHAAGAVGIISLINPASMDIPWSRISLNRTHPTMDLDYPEFDETSGAQLSVTVNPANAEKFFAGSGHTFAEIAELGKDRKPLPHFPLALSLEAKTKVETQKVESANLVAKLQGSDPTLKDEYVALSAHIDHVGIGAPINGDSIYNGAMDDGSGSALLLDTAASFKKNPDKLRRSIL